MGNIIKRNIQRRQNSKRTLGRRALEAGNIFLMLFGAVGMVGIIGASTMTVMKGPVRTMSIVTKRTIAENNMIATSRLSLIAAASQSPNDCDGDGSIEPIPYSTMIPTLNGGGEIPPGIGVARQDPWGTQYGYCVWDHGSVIDDTACGVGGVAGAGLNQGDSSNDGYVLAILSAGPDGTFQTECNDDSATDPYINRQSGSDDLVLGVTYGEANSVAAGLWTLQAGNPDIAEIAKDLEVTSSAGNLAFGVAEVDQSGTDRPSIQVDYISELSSGANVEFLHDVIAPNINATGIDASAGINLSTANSNITLNNNFLSGDGADEGISINSGGDVTTSHDLTVGGALNLTDLNVPGNTTLGDNATVDTIDIVGITNITGNVTLNNDLDVAGDTNLTTLGATGAVDFDSTLNVDGNATLGADLTVNGTTTLNGNVTLGDAISDTLTANTALNMGNNLITNLADARAAPTGNLDAINRQTMDAAITTAVGGVTITELDPQVDVINPGRLCLGDAAGTAIDCETDITAIETDPEVGTLAANNYCQVNATGTAIDCNVTDIDPVINQPLINDNYCQANATGTAIDCDQTASDILSGATLAIDDLTDAYANYTDNNLIMGNPSAGALANGATNNTFIGVQVGATSASATTTTTLQNTGLGFNLLTGLTEGDRNTAIGSDALNANTTGLGNVAIGSNVLNANITGSDNVAIGKETFTTALLGNQNIAIGRSAMHNAPNSGNDNIALGTSTLDANTIGSDNIAIGRSSLGVKVGGSNNIAIGLEAGNLLTSGSNNILIGRNADTATVAASEELNIGNILFGDIGITSTDPKIGAHQYCDEALTNCFEAADVGGVAASAAQLIDADGDTLIQVEEGADDDTIRFDTAGTERMTIDPTGIVNIVNDATLASNLTVDGATALNGNITLGDAAADTITFTGTANSALNMGTNLITSVADARPSPAGDLDAINRQTMEAAIGGITETDPQVDAIATAGRYCRSDGTAIDCDQTAADIVGAGGGSDEIVDADGDTLVQVEEGTDDDTIRFTTAGSERASILPTGELMIGDTTLQTLSNSQAIVQSFTGDATKADIIFGYAGTSASAKSDIDLFRAKGNTTTPTAVTSGDQLGSLRFSGHDGTQFVTRAQIRAEIDGAVTTGTVPTAIIFRTSDSSFMSDDGLERMRIASDGTVSIRQLLDMTAEKIINLADPTNAQDAATKAYVDSVAGGGAINDLSDASYDSSAVGSLYIGHNAPNATAVNEENTAVGYNALSNVNSTNATADRNTAMGWSALRDNTDGAENTATGYVALRRNTTGTNNTAHGNQALTANTTGINNTSIGSLALSANTTGTRNTAMGRLALRALNTGDRNTALGSDAARNLTTGSHNVFLGNAVADNLTSGSDNIIIGNEILTSSATASNELNIGDLIYGDLANNEVFLDAPAAAAPDADLANGQVTFWVDAANDEIEVKARDSAGDIINATIGAGGGANEINELTDAAKDLTNNNLFIAHEGGAAGANNIQNTAIGIGALDALNNSAGADEGDFNTAIGYIALTSNTTGNRNTATGNRALTSNTTGDFNTAYGALALFSNTTGNANTAIGNGALFRNTTGNNNTATGVHALTNNTEGNNNAIFGHRAAGNESVTNGFYENNTLMGYQAGFNMEGGATSGAGADNNILMGYRAGAMITTGDNNIIIGYDVDSSSATASNELNIGDLIYGDLANNEVFLDAPAVAAPDADLANGQVTFWVDAANDEIELKARDSAGDIINATIGGGGASAINDLSDAYTDYATDFNLFMGENTGTGVVAGAQYNLAIGQKTLNASLTSTADFNIAIGNEILTNNTSGRNNVAIGNEILTNNTSGRDNISIGTSPLYNNISGRENMATGHSALFNNTTGNHNTAYGWATMFENTTGNHNLAMGWNTLYSNTEGRFNTVIGNSAAGDFTGTGGFMERNTILGYRAGHALAGGATSGAGPDNNLLLGYQAGDLITTGDENIIIGYNVDPSSATASNELNIGDILFGSGVGTTAGSKIGAVEFCDETLTDCFDPSAIAGGAVGAINDLSDAISDGSSVFLGAGAGANDDGTANQNNAVGINALAANTAGIRNTANGNSTLENNTTGDSNTANGFRALNANTTGGSNTANGFRALENNTTGGNNTAIGTNSLFNNTGGSENVVIGVNAAGNSAAADGFMGLNTVLGTLAGFNLTGGATNGAGADNNILLGYRAGDDITTGDFNIMLGFDVNPSSATAAAELNIGNIIKGDLGIISSNPRIGAPRYCDENLANCFLATDVGGSAVSAINDLDDAFTDYTTDDNFIMGRASATALTAGASRNTFIGNGAGATSANSTANTDHNTAIGYQALSNNTSARENTAVGSQALQSNTTGTQNTASGAFALQNNTTGNQNTAVGRSTLVGNTSGTQNTAVGRSALASNTIGNENTAHGSNTLLTNTSGSNNTAIGTSVLQNNTIGGNNTAVGRSALVGNTTGDNNTVSGRSALASNTIGNNNTASGRSALIANTSGNNNVAFGYQAGDLITTGSNNILIGSNVDSSSATASNELNIGNIFFGSGTGTTAGSKVGAVEYCDENLANCFLATDVSGGGGGSSEIGGLSDAFTDYTTNHNFIMGRTSATALASGAQYNTFIGENAGATTANSTAATNENTAIGANALENLTTGRNNTAIGSTSMASTTGGQDNTSIGRRAMEDNTTGSGNVAVGQWALQNNIDGNANVALGFNALGGITDEDNTVGVGNETGALTTSASQAVFVGHRAGFGPGSSGNAIYDFTVLLGYNAGRASNGVAPFDMTDSVAIGWGAGSGTTSATESVIIGSIAGDNLDDGDRNVFIGFSAGSDTASGDDNILIGHNIEASNATASDELNIGDLIYGDLANNEVFLDAPATAAPDADLANGQVTFWVDAANDEIELKARDSAGDIINVTVGGAAGGASAINDLTDAYLNQTNDNFIMGMPSAAALTGGAVRNTFIGTNVGATSASATSATTLRNTAVGHDVLTALTTGDRNTAVGSNALLANTTGAQNVAIGTDVLDVNTTGNHNVAIGVESLGLSTTGSYNIAIGPAMSLGVNTGSYNIALGETALANNTTGDHNIVMGQFAALHKTTGSHNIVMGQGAGDSLTAGAGNILIGLGTDTTTPTSSNQLNIGNTIYGSLSSDRIGIGQFPAAGVELDVLGDIEYTGTITDVSDRRLKKDIKPLSDMGSALDLITQVDTYSFKMKDDKDGKTEFGVMAQDLEKIFPTLVHTASDEIGTKSVNYTGLTAPLIEAVKEIKALIGVIFDKIEKLFNIVVKLQTENKVLKSEVENLKSQNQDIIKRLETLEANNNQQTTQ